MRLQAGTLLHGDTYQIEKVLGQGSFGITYLAMHTVLERKVCIKEFFMKEINTRNVDGSITGMTDGSLSYNYGQKFKKEALNLSRLDHPNIVRVTDSFEENGTYYYVMDYIDGDNLNDYLKGHEVTQKEALSIIRDVATALMYMHEEKKMLHLDLKPGNIMRRHGDGHIFLIDFGLSKHYSSDGQPETSTSIGLGTAGYAPIEQANQMKSGEFRPTIDVYALGATLYKLLTRETPPQGSEIVSDDELIESKLRANGITGPIIDVVVNAMQPSVRKRTQSVKAFLDSLPYGTEEKPAKPKPKAKKKPTAKPKEESSGEETEVLGGSEKRKEQPFVEANWRILAEYVNYPTTTAEKENNGDVDAMFAIGMMLLRGQGLGQSIESAQSYFLKAQAEGDAKAKKVLEDWEKLKKKYEKKRTKTNVGVVESRFSKFFTKYATAIMIIAGVFFVYDIICCSMEQKPHADNLHTLFGYGILHNLVELFLIYTVGVKLLTGNKWYLAFATLGIVLWLGKWSIDWNAYYVWYVMGETLTDGMAEFSQFISDCSQYGGLMLIIAFLIGVILAKQVINKIIFVLLMIYAGTQFIPHYMNSEDINWQVLLIIEYVILLLAIVLYFYSENKKNTLQT